MAKASGTRQGCCALARRGQPTALWSEPFDTMLAARMAEGVGCSFGQAREAKRHYVPLLITRASEGGVAVSISPDRIVRLSEQQHSAARRAQAHGGDAAPISRLPPIRFTTVMA